MKKKGFTLVELLAVIVILAIIAIIATPIILGVIEKERIGAAKQSALGYIDAVEKQIVINSMDEDKSNDFENKGYTIDELTNLGVNVKGTIPRSDSDKDIITITNKKVESAKLTVGDYSVEIDKNGKATVTKTGATKEEKYTVYANGTAVYYNPETNKKCSESEAVSTTETKSGCMKWYTFNDEGEKNSKVNMILDHNTTAKVEWNSTKSNSEMKEVATALSNDTANWNSSLNARLITANEVAGITGNTSFSESTSTSFDWFYFDSNSMTQTATSKGASKYAWLFDYTVGCTSSGCNIADSSTWGYWTSTPVAGSSSNAWIVYRSGYLHGYYVNIADFGVRPVITVLKSKIS